MILNLKNKKALVTGGTRGIGAAIVDELLKSGAFVMATGTNDKTLQSLQKKADKQKQAIEYIKVDFLNDKETSWFLSSLKNQSFDILINNAGINKINLTGDVDPQDWDSILKVNLKIPFLLSKALAPKMAKKKYGRIVNVSSVFGHISKSQRVCYSSSKFGLEGMTKALALDYAAEGVLVNSIAPGFIKTDLTESILTPSQQKELISQVPLKRFGTPNEIAKAVLFLVSDANTFITGQSILIDGGFTIA